MASPETPLFADETQEEVGRYRQIFEEARSSHGSVFLSRSRNALIAKSRLDHLGWLLGAIAVAVTLLRLFVEANFDPTTLVSLMTASSPFAITYQAVVIVLLVAVIIGSYYLFFALANVGPVHGGLEYIALTQSSNGETPL